MIIKSYNDHISCVKVYNYITTGGVANLIIKEAHIHIIIRALHK